ncbi:MAG: hypothetical protein RIC80_11535 [Cyclobacteriaceae bacterium]
MYVPFDQLPDHSRLWIYQSSRPFSQEEQLQISVALKTFCELWNAHHQPLNSSFDIRFDRFIILSVDEGVHAASGCSIDSSVAVIRQIAEQFGVDMFNRLDQALLLDQQVVVKSLAEIKKELAAETLSEDTKVFNNLVMDLAEFKSGWIVPISDSWLSRFVPVN